MFLIDTLKNNPEAAPESREGEFQRASKKKKKKINLHAKLEVRTFCNLV